MSQYAITRGDIFGGLTAGIVALPLCLAFGVASGLGPAAGLYGGIILGILASLVGGTPVQVSGPTAPMTLIPASVIETRRPRVNRPPPGIGADGRTFGIG